MTNSNSGSDAHLDIEQLTDEAAHLTRGERDKLIDQIHHLDDSDLDYDDELDFAEVLANKNALA